MTETKKTHFAAIFKIDSYYVRYIRISSCKYVAYSNSIFFYFCVKQLFIRIQNHNLVIPLVLAAFVTVHCSRRYHWPTSNNNSSSRSHCDTEPSTIKKHTHTFRRLYVCFTCSLRCQRLIQLFVELCSQQQQQQQKMRTNLGIAHKWFVNHKCLHITSSMCR